MKLIKLHLFIFAFLFANYSIGQECPDSCQLNIPNSLTTDCDDFNCGILNIETTCPITNFHLLIFNRWGEVLFESDDIENKFDCGENKDGTYTLKLTGEFCNEEEIEVITHFNILR